MPSDPDIVVLDPADGGSGGDSDGDSSDGGSSSDSGSGGGSSSGDEGGSGGGSSGDGSGEDGSGEDGSSSGGTTERNWLDWALVIAGAAIVLGVVGFLVYQIATLPDEPAALEVTLDAPEVSGGTAMIPVTVENVGSKVAEAAVIEVCAGPESCAEVSFTYVPQGSTREGEVGLSAPLAGPLETRVVSFRTP